jgi:hypothetical protein
MNARKRQQSLDEFDAFCAAQRQRLTDYDLPVTARDLVTTVKKDVMESGEVEVRGNTTHPMGGRKPALEN